jgi:dGTPase
MNPAPPATSPNPSSAPPRAEREAAGPSPSPGPEAGPPATGPNPSSAPPRAEREAAGPSPSPDPAHAAAEAVPKASGAQPSDRPPSGEARPGAPARNPRQAAAGERPLAHLAADPSRSRGRRHAEDDRINRGPRDAFQRDRDRIIHSVPFRRLRHKTQVFVAPDGDHYRVRLTHSLEVAQIARALARTLGLNEDLTEALALAHDIGHPPFGHAGEDVLQAAMAEAGGFDHNAHTIRLLTRLETPYPRFAGLNLSWETLEGLAKHNGPVDAPTWALAEADSEWPLELGSWPSLEAQIAAIADDIAYDNHDIDDGLRAGLFTLEELLAVPLAARAWTAVKDRYPDVADARLIPELVRDLIGAMVNDVLAETRARAAGIASPEAVRAAARPLAGFSAAMAAEERTLKAFLHARMYEAPQVRTVRAEAQRLLAGLFEAYRADPERLPPEWRSSEDSPTSVTRAVGDFIAGMTDRYALRRHAELVGPSALPESFAAG